MYGSLFYDPFPLPQIFHLLKKLFMEFNMEKEIKNIQWKRRDIIGK